MHESEKWKWSRSVMSDPQQPHGLQPTRLISPWDSPGKSTGVGCLTSHCKMSRCGLCTQMPFMPTGHKWRWESLFSSMPLNAKWLKPQDTWIPPLWTLKLISQGERFCWLTCLIRRVKAGKGTGEGPWVSWNWIWNWKVSAMQCSPTNTWGLKGRPRERMSWS